MSNCPADKPNATCMPGTQECYYNIAIGLCDGSKSRGRCHGVGCGMSAVVSGKRDRKVEVGTGVFFIDVSESALGPGNCYPVSTPLPPTTVKCRH